MTQRSMYMSEDDNADLLLKGHTIKKTVGKEINKAEDDDEEPR